MKKLFLLILLIALSCKLLSQEEYFRADLDWYTITTEHFLIHFHNGSERTAKEVAKIAESIYNPITDMYHYKPESKTNIIIKDYNDYSNGGAYFYENKIEIWALSLDMDLRGSHPWLLNVVTHEFAHLIQIRTAMKFGKTFPGIYLQVIGYENERRPDVLYGFPNVLVSYPLPGLVLPPWFAEGVAQYNSPNLKYDYWDTHRDMILRMLMLGNNELSWEEMGVFGKTSLGNESVYNSGFSLVEYIAKNYGDNKLEEISRNISAPLCLSFNQAIKNAIGISGIDLYEKWKSEKKIFYKAFADSLQPYLTEEDIIENDGFGNFYPTFINEGQKIAYVSNKSGDYFGNSNIYLYDLETKKTEMLVAGVRSAISISPDNKFIFYSKRTDDNKRNSLYSDIFRFDIDNKKEERLTFGLRAFNPNISKDGKRIVFSFGNDGTLNIGVCGIDGKNICKLTNFSNGEQVYNPVWSTTGEKIAFGYSIGHNQNIAIIDSNGSNLKIYQHSGDSRNPFFQSDTTLFYSNNANGIFNIYMLNINTYKEEKITNVLGGAFYPNVNEKGSLTYSTFKTDGYKIAYVQKYLSDKNYSNIVPNKTLEYNTTDILSDTIKQNIYMDSSDNAIPYNSVFSNLLLMPVIRYDNYTEGSSFLDQTKIGMYMLSNEVIDKMNLFGGGVINYKGERDLFLQYTYKGRLPILYQIGLNPIFGLELYNTTRKRNISFDLFIDEMTNIKTELTYNLFEMDLSLKQLFFSDGLQIKFNYALTRYNIDFGSWYHPRFGTIPANRSTYFIGNAFSLQLKHQNILNTIDKEINPVGMIASLKYYYEKNKFNPTDSSETSSETGFRKPVYTKYNHSKIEFGMQNHIALPIKNHTFTLSINYAGVLCDSTEEFFNYYAGGLLGMRGYPYYAIGGSKTITVKAEYRLPIFREINFRLFNLYFKKLYASVFYDIGNAWDKNIPTLKTWKRDVGVELRLEAFSFYSYPTRIFFSGAYGLDSFSKKVVDIRDVKIINYGKEWRYYLGVLFDFELNDLIKFKTY